MLLGDMGADVIKVEQPRRGDMGRATAPMVDGQSTRHLVINRNKRSLELDLKATRGRELFLDLLKSADVLIEGFRPGVMARLQLDYPTVSAECPRLVYCSIAGYSSDSVMSDRGGHDLNFLGTSGMLSLSGGRTGTPTPPPVQIADIAGGSYPAVVAVLAALYERTRSGLGDHVELSLADGAFYLQVEAMSMMSAGRLPAAGSTRLTGRYPAYNVYESRDGVHYALGALEVEFWRRLCDVLGRTDLVEHGLLDDERGAECMRALVAEFGARDSDELDRLFEADVCCTRVRSWSEVIEDPEVFRRGLLTRARTRDGVAHLQLGLPISLDRSPSRVARDAPRLGEHTEEVLHELGIGADELRVLRDAGTI
jgi:crotonobetainyl-CoA:carnitine CoA-transferase CaiB-like acyl-CoA transferase